MGKLDEFHKMLKPIEFDKSIFCFVRSATSTSLEASFDIGTTWDRIPLKEAVSAELIRDVHMPKGRYPLVRLVLKEQHPTIELAAARAHDALVHAALCRCREPQRPGTVGVVQPDFGHFSGSHLEACLSEATFCEKVACVWWALGMTA